MTALGDRRVSVREVAGPPRNVFQNLAEGGVIPFSGYLAWVLDTAALLASRQEHGSDVRSVVNWVDSHSFERSYYLDTNLPRLSLSLAGEVPVPDWYRREPLDVNLWCGVMGTSSGLHCDVTPNCNMQVIGEKHFTLFPPSASARVYRVSCRGTHCLFDPDRPDVARFPRSTDVSGLSCLLRPGDALYIPVGWFHQVTVVSGWALNVNVFWPRPFPQGLLLPRLWPFLARRGVSRFRQEVLNAGVRRLGRRLAA